ncbi:MAG: T9SS type A sorting domain-containing protein, partial [Bacteroidales bacterium]|nr:T9SS type A sorting domain-containing protein [Bacteroidales bacterium]
MTTFLKTLSKTFLVLLAMLFATMSYANWFGPAGVYISVNGEERLYRLNDENWGADAGPLSGDPALIPTFNNVDLGMPVSLVIDRGIGIGNGPQLNDRWRIFYRIVRVGGTQTTPWVGNFMQWTNSVTGGNQQLTASLGVDILALASGLAGAGTYQLQIGVILDNATAPDVWRTATFTIVEGGPPVFNVSTTPATGRNLDGNISITVTDGNAPFSVTIGDSTRTNVSIGATTMRNLGAGTYRISVEDANGNEIVDSVIVGIAPGTIEEPTINISLNQTTIFRNENFSFEVSGNEADSVVVLINNVYVASFSFSGENFSETVPFTPTEARDHWIRAIAISDFGFRREESTDFIVRDSVSATWHFTNTPPFENDVPLGLVVNLFDADSAVLRLDGAIIHRSQNEDGFSINLPTPLTVGNRSLSLTAYGFRNTTAPLNKSFTIVQGTSNVLLLEENVVKAFPNPASTYLILQGANLTIGTEIFIYNMLGRLVGTYR